MPDRPNFPIPENIHAEPFCLCIKVPNDPTWKQVVNGLLMELNYWYNWQRDDARSGTECAKVWRELYNAIDWSIMSCCCGNQPPLIFRFGPGGVYQKSSDGGVTWTNAPEYDPRVTSTAQPNPNDLGISTTNCAAADSVGQSVKQGMVQNLNDSMTAADIVAVVAAALLIYLSAGTLGYFAAQITAVGAAIIAAGVAAYQSAFTDTVWHDFTCIVWRHMESDLSFTQADIDDIISELDSKFAGLAHMGLLTAIQVAGPVGLTNMARSGKGNPDYNCDDCDNSAKLYALNGAGSYVQVLPGEDGLYTVTGEYLDSGKYYLDIIFNPTDDRSTWTPCNDITIVDDDPNRETGYTLNLRCHDGVPDALSHCNYLVQYRGTAQFTIKVSLNDADPCT